MLLFTFSPEDDNSLELDDKFPCRFFSRSAPFIAPESSVQVTHINGMKYRISFSPHCASAVLKGHKLLVWGRCRFVSLSTGAEKSLLLIYDSIKREANESWSLMILKRYKESTPTLSSPIAVSLRWSTQIGEIFCHKVTKRASRGDSLLRGSLACAAIIKFKLNCRRGIRAIERVFSSSRFLFAPRAGRPSCDILIPIHGSKYANN